MYIRTLLPHPHKYPFLPFLMTSYEISFNYKNSHYAPLRSAMRDQTPEYAIICSQFYIKTFMHCLDFADGTSVGSIHSVCIGWGYKNANPPLWGFQNQKSPTWGILSYPLCSRGFQVPKSPIIPRGF